jgi:hypothetical protein
VAPTQKKDVDPKKITVYGRLSFPRWTAKEAYDASQKGQYPAKDVASAKPEFNLILEQAQFDKFMAHVENVFFPYCVAQAAAGEKRDVLTEAEVKKLLDGLKGDLSDQMFNTPLKAVHEKTAALAPEGVASLKCIGNAGVDIEQKAIVAAEDELVVPDPDQLTWPVIKPISQTVHSMYPGAYVAVTLNLYAYHNDPKRPGFGAGASVAVFKADGDRFGGGVSVDEDEIFLD